MINFKYQYYPETLLKKNNISYYILGAFISDGCVKTGTSVGQVSLSSKDKDWLEDIKNILCPDKPIYQDDNCFCLTLSHPDIRKFLIENKCTERKSLTVQMPDIPKEYLPDFLRGCIDGDGCICILTKKKRIMCELASSSSEFIYSLKEILKNFNPKIYCQKQKYYKLRFNGAYAYKFLKFLKYETGSLSMKRKLVKSIKAICLYESYGFDPNINNIEHQVRSLTQSGSNNGQSKLTENEVKLIIDLLKSNSSIKIAKQFNVSKTTILRIKNGKSWKLLTN